MNQTAAATPATENIARGSNSHRNFTLPRLLSLAAVLTLLTASGAQAVSQYEFLQQRDFPLFAWNFNEAGGNAIDQANGGAANDLVPQGAATRVSHASIGSGLNLGNSASFNGANGTRFFTADLDGASINFVPTQLWVAEMWIQVQGANVGSRGDYLLEGNFGGANNPGLIYDFNYGAGDTNELEVFSPSGRSGAAGPAVNDGNFHHVLFAFYGNSGGFGIANRRDIVIDGVTFSDTTSGFSSGFGLQQIALGNTVAGGGVNGFEGRIDEFAIYDVGSMLSNPLTFGNAASIAEFQAIVQNLAAHNALGAAGESTKFFVTPVSYVYDPAGIQPIGAGPRSDAGLTKLTDGVTGRTNGGGAPTANFDSGQWVGFAEAVFGQDNGNPHPGVTFDLGTAFNLSEIWIDYLAAGGNAGIEAPDSVDVRLSMDGVTFGPPINFTGFNDADTGGNDFFSRRLILELGGSARYVSLSFNNDNQWTFLSEVTFVATTVPEPASALLLMAAIAPLLRRRTRAERTA